MTATRLVIAAPAQSLTHSEFDGFITRHIALVTGLIEDPLLEVHLLSLGAAQSWRSEVRFANAAAIREVEWFEREVGRWGRVLIIGRRVIARGRGAADPRLGELLREIRPDAAITLGPWFDTQFAAVFDACPTLHFYEEDVTPLYAKSRASRLLHRIDVLARRAAPEQPAHVAVISDREVPAARARYGATVPLTVVPYAPPAAQWPVSSPDSGGDHVLVMGALWQERNATGLVELLLAMDNLASPPPVRLVSDEGLHETVKPFLDRHWLEHAPSQWPARANYDGARVTVVPARRATGIKTTILQAWACGVPVVTYEESAATLHCDDKDAVIAAGSGQQMAADLVRVWNAPAERLALATAGRRALYTHHDEDRNLQTVIALVRALARPDQNPTL